MSMNRSDHITKAQELLDEWAQTRKDVESLLLGDNTNDSNAEKIKKANLIKNTASYVHGHCTEVLMAAQVHATLAESMRALDAKSMEYTEDWW